MRQPKKPRTQKVPTATLIRFERLHSHGQRSNVLPLPAGGHHLASEEVPWPAACNRRGSARGHGTNKGVQPTNEGRCEITSIQIFLTRNHDGKDGGKIEKQRHCHWAFIQTSCGQGSLASAVVQVCAPTQFDSRRRHSRNDKLGCTCHSFRLST